MEENSPTGSFIGLVEANDIDSGTFGQVEYSLDGPSDVINR